MKKKLNSYQKLKAENLALKQDLYALVMWDDPSTDNPEFLKKFAVKLKWKTQFNTEHMIWGFPAK